MNMFKFFKSVSGKVQLTLVNTSAVALVAGGFAASALYNVGEVQGQRELQVRSLSALSRESSYEGLQTRNGLLTSINVKDGLNQVATSEERAALEGNGSTSSFGLDAVDRLNGVSFGSAAETSATDGLGMGANAAAEVPGGTRASAGNAAADQVNGMVNSARTAAATQAQQLSSASMARASGNAFNAAAGAISSGAPSGRNATRGTVDGYQLSGAMPTGTNAVSAMGLQREAQTRSSTFMAGGRDGSVGPGRRTFSEKNDLKDISKRSADAAGNRNRAANEGSRAFLAGSVNSGGMVVDGGIATGEGAGSADFKAPEAKRLKAVGNWKEKTDDTAKRRSKARSTLTWLLLGTAATAIVGMLAGYHLINKGSKAKPFGWGLVIAGLAIIAVALGMAVTLLIKAGKYASEFSGGTLPTICGIVGGLAIAALGLTVAAAFVGKDSPLNKFTEKIFPQFKKAAIKMGKGVAVETGVNTAKEQILKDD